MDVSTVGIIALAMVTALIVPIAIRGRHTPADGGAELPVEDEIARYRTAVRADTLCSRCGQANPADAKYCHECGRSLPRVDAQEFDGTEAS
jgi:ribosomal protein L40E